MTYPGRAKAKLARFARTAGWLLVLVAAAITASLIDEWIDPPRQIDGDGRQIVVADGDSFAIGGQKLRLDGIDAPEYRQTCADGSGAAWECGKASRASLELLLREPGLSCSARAIDKYARSIATCSNARITDIAANQVRNGMALSDEYFGMRSYGDEEDEARSTKRGLWTGDFLRPDEWRAANGR